jgi:subtilisin-like proprotein convertase family protein
MNTRFLNTVACLLSLIFINTLAAAPPVAGAGNAIKLDGVDDYIVLDAVAPVMAGHQASVTISFWVRPDNSYTNTKQGGLFAVHGAGGVNKLILLVGDYYSGTPRDNRIVVYDAGIQLTGPVIGDGQWHHVAWIRDGTQASLYVDGFHIGTYSSTFVLYNDDLWSVGQEYDGASPSDYLNGHIDEVYLWNTVRTSNQVRNFMYRPTDTNENWLIGYWWCNETSGTSLFNATGYGYDGVLVNSTGAWQVSGAWQTPIIYGDNTLILGAGYDPDFTIPDLIEVQAPLHGTMHLSNDALLVTYTPDSGYTGTDSFAWAVSDGSATASYAVTAMMISGQYRYVSPAGTHSPPFMTWATAATNIQAAVDIAEAGETIIVTNGIYNAGSRPTPGYQLASRVVIDKQVTVRSVNGPASTIILGAPDPDTGSAGSNAVRCAYLGNGARLEGFLLSNGFTWTSGNAVYNRCGAGALINSNGVLAKCIIADNTAHHSGAGVLLQAGGTVLDSTIGPRNTAEFNAGGIYCRLGGLVTNCTVRQNTVLDSSNGKGGGIFLNTGGNVWCSIIESNTAAYGAGISLWEGGYVCNSIIRYHTGFKYGAVSFDTDFMSDPCGTINRCIIHNNRTETGSANGGGIKSFYRANIFNTLIYANKATFGAGIIAGYYTKIINCTIADNTGEGIFTYMSSPEVRNAVLYNNSDNLYDVTDVQYSCSSDAPSGSGNTTSPPQFINAAGRDYRLQPASPCRNTGTNAEARGSRDLRGMPRILGGTIDMGCYEGAVDVILAVPSVTAPVSVPAHATGEYSCAMVSNVWVHGTKASNSLVGIEQNTDLLTTNGILQSLADTVWSNYTAIGYSAASVVTTMFDYISLSSDLSIVSDGRTRLYVYNYPQPQAAQIFLHNLEQTYDGQPKPVHATTDPPGLTVEITYNGSPSPPVKVGNYTIIAAIDETSFHGMTNGTLVIQPCTPVISANALVFPSAGSMVLAETSTGIVWEITAFDDARDGSNLTMSTIALVREIHLQVDILTIAQAVPVLQGSVQWQAPTHLISPSNTYCIRLEVENSYDITSSRTFMSQPFTIRYTTPPVHTNVTYGTGVGFIPDDDDPLDILFTVTNLPGPVSDIALSMDLSHPYMSDLTAELDAPERNPLDWFTIFYPPGNYNADFFGVYAFTDNTTNDLYLAADEHDTVPPCAYRTFDGSTTTSFRVDSGFIGLLPAQATGVWEMTIQDIDYGESGSISEAILSLMCAQRCVPYVLVNALEFPANGSQVICEMVTNITWNSSRIFDNDDGTNITIACISIVIPADPDTPVLIITNTVPNTCETIQWYVPYSLCTAAAEYAVCFDVVNSVCMTNTTVFSENVFSVIPEPLGACVVLLVVAVWWRKLSYRS